MHLNRLSETRFSCSPNACPPPPLLFISIHPKKSGDLISSWIPLLFPCICILKCTWTHRIEDGSRLSASLFSVRWRFKFTNEITSAHAPLRLHLPVICISSLVQINWLMDGGCKTSKNDWLKLLSRDTFNILVAGAVEVPPGGLVSPAGYFEKSDESQSFLLVNKSKLIRVKLGALVR